MEFSYQARDNSGTLKVGTVEAMDSSAAFGILQSHGLIIIKISPLTKLNILASINIIDRVSMKEVVLFSRQLATLIDAKVPIVQALEILRGQLSSKKLQEITLEISEKVQSGESLSAALAGYPDIFSKLYVSLIRAGELSGTIDEAFSYLANQLEKDYDLRSKIRGALSYPAFILSALFIVGFLMFVFVLPPLVSVLQEAAVELPITTRILIAATSLVNGFWWLMAILLVGALVGLRIYSKTFVGAYFLDYIKIKMPIFGKLMQRIYLARFSRNLSTLLRGGIPIVRALESVADIVGNRVYTDVIFEAAGKVRNGKSIAAAFGENNQFPLIISQMIQIGESTGKLQEILEKLAIFYEKEVEGLVKVLTTLLEPIVMILIGLAVAVMVAGILLPIYNLASAA